MTDTNARPSNPQSPPWLSSLEVDLKQLERQQAESTGLTRFWIEKLVSELGFEPNSQKPINLRHFLMRRVSEVIRQSEPYGTGVNEARKIIEEVACWLDHHGQIAAAALLHYEADSARPSEPLFAPRRVAIQDLGLSLRTQNSLLRAGFRYADELKDWSDQPPIKVKGLGEIGLQELRTALDIEHIPSTESP
jgi:hypothetical protein